MTSRRFTNKVLIVTSKFMDIRFEKKTHLNRMV